MAAMVAKPIVKDQLWVITDGARKIGNIESTNNRFTVTIGDNITYYTDPKTIEQGIDIRFEKPHHAKSKNPPFAVWPTPKKKTYNNYWDLKRKIHVFTKTKSSKCYYVAGWFNMRIGERWQTVFSPKYIFIQRYQYNGPHLTEGTATAALNTLQGESLNE